MQKTGQKEKKRKEQSRFRVKSPLEETVSVVYNRSVILRIKRQDTTPSAKRPPTKPAMRSDMLKRLYNKSQIAFSVVWIVAYCVFMSLGDSISSALGTEKSATLFVALALSLLLLLFLKKNGLLACYGLRSPQASAKSMLYYLPLLWMISANAWNGLSPRFGLAETACYVLTMLLVGFLEELIFRGLLYHALRKESERTAILVSSLTFGIGHLINLFNGSGAELLPNILQVVYATSAGFLFVTILRKSNSLWICIFAHGLFNALSAFAIEPSGNTQRILTSLALAAITGLYAVYLAQSPWPKAHRNKNRPKI